jgi:hypothetical protein
MRGLAVVLSSAALVLSAVVPAIASEHEVKVLRSIPWSADAKVRPQVKAQCQIETRLPEYLAQSSDQVRLVEGPLGASGRVLELTITNARTVAGGWVSGGKWVTVVGVLREDDREIGNFLAKRLTIGYFNFTACSAAARSIKATARDIAEWLKDPQPDSKLGSAQ